MACSDAGLFYFPVMVANPYRITTSPVFEVAPEFSVPTVVMDNNATGGKNDQVLRKGYTTEFKEEAVRLVEAGQKIWLYNTLTYSMVTMRSVSQAHLTPYIKLTA
jgi:hypothetical protein